MVGTYDRTPRLGLPLMSPAGQQNAQILWNEAMILLEPLMQRFVLDIATNPTTPSNGDSYIVGGSPTGTLAGFTPNNLAVWWNGAFIEIEVKEGFCVWVDDESQYRTFHSGSWQVGPT